MPLPPRAWNSSMVALFQSATPAERVEDPSYSPGVRRRSRQTEVGQALSSRVHERVDLARAHRRREAAHAASGECDAVVQSCDVQVAEQWPIAGQHGRVVRDWPRRQVNIEELPYLVD